LVFCDTTLLNWQCWIIFWVIFIESKCNYIIFCHIKFNAFKQKEHIFQSWLSWLKESKAFQMPMENTMGAFKLGHWVQITWIGFHLEMFYCFMVFSNEGCVHLEVFLNLLINPWSFWTKIIPPSTHMGHLIMLLFKLLQHQFFSMLHFHIYWPWIHMSNLSTL
jgi:hypothetical protein